MEHDKTPKQRRRVLRQAATPAEKAMWLLLRNFRLLGRKFRRQHSIGPFIADFCCVHEKLVIELDGQVHYQPGAQDYDHQRSEYLKEQGFQVLRYENRQVFEAQDSILHDIQMHFEEYQARQGGVE